MLEVDYFDLNVISTSQFKKKFRFGLIIIFVLIILSMPKTLAIFDVDLTVCEGFLDEALFTAMDHDFRQIQYQKGFSGKQTWAEIINRALQTHPPQMHQIESHISQVPMVAGMKEVFSHLKEQPDMTLAILSGGNNLLVRKYLQIHQCSHYFDQIFATPLTYDANSHSYSYEAISVKCQLPSCDTCKMKAFDFHEFCKDYDKVLYVGDGLNDLCGMSLLKSGWAFIRQDQQLHKRIQKSEQLLQSIKVESKYWKNGFDLAHQIRSLF